MLAHTGAQLLPFACAASHAYAAFPALVGAANHAWLGRRHTGLQQTVIPGEQARHDSTTALHQDHSGVQDKDHDTHTAREGPAEVPHSSTGSLGHSSVAPHPGMSTAASSSVPWLPADVQTVMKHHVYPKDYLESIKPKHLVPDKLHQKLAYATIQAIRRGFDLATGYGHGRTMTEQQWLRRIIFLETVAGVPGMVAGMMRHLRSLRLMRRDNGWINTLLEEAENERMHLLTFMEMRKPGILFRGAVIGAQATMMTGLTLGYAISPKFCHALVGYLEEEAVKTYTVALEDIDAGKLWPNKPAPLIAVSYWRLPQDATMRDLILAVRADEACHSHVNHTFARIPQDGPNPFTDKNSHMVP